MKMTHLESSLSSIALAICLAPALHAQTLLNVKIGQTANNGGTDGAYQEIAAAVLGSGNAWWNEYAFVSSTPYLVSVVDSGDSAIAGVTLTVQNSSGVGSLTTSGNPSFLMSKMPYMNPGGVFTISLTGLAAHSQYEFVGYSAYPGLTLGASWAVTTGTFDSGIAANDGTSADITTGAGKAYSDFYVTTDGSGNLTITDSSLTSTYTVLSGFQLQAVPVPEPATVAMGMMGLALLAGFQRMPRHKK